MIARALGACAGTWTEPGGRSCPPAGGMAGSLPGPISMRTTSCPIPVRRSVSWSAATPGSLLVDVRRSGVTDAATDRRAWSALWQLGARRPAVRRAWAGTGDVRPVRPDQGDRRVATCPVSSNITRAGLRCAGQPGHPRPPRPHLRLCTVHRLAEVTPSPARRPAATAAAAHSERPQGKRRPKE